VHLKQDIVYIDKYIDQYLEYNLFLFENKLYFTLRQCCNYDNYEEDNINICIDKKIMNGDLNYIIYIYENILKLKIHDVKILIKYIDYYTSFDKYLKNNNYIEQLNKFVKFDDFKKLNDTYHPDLLNLIGSFVNLKKLI
jgi:hypothetical protein